ncbi:MAG: glycosyltransferase [Pseudomonadales bacterium]
MTIHEPAPIQIYVGTDRSQRIGLKVLEYSIRKTTSRQFKVHSLEHLKLPEPVDKRQTQRTGFSFSRFAIPQLSNFTGKAIYMDADMLVFQDIGQLWDLPFEGKKIHIQGAVPTESKLRSTGKFNAVKRAKQCSVALLDCAALNWRPEQIIAGLDGQYSYKQLMEELCILDESEIGYAIPAEWNSLEYWDEQTCNLHYTDMQTQPWVSARNKNGQRWLSVLREMRSKGIISTKEIQTEVELGFARPSLLVELNDELTVGESPIKHESRLQAYEDLDNRAGFQKHNATYAAKHERDKAEKEYIAALKSQSASRHFERFLNGLSRVRRGSLESAATQNLTPSRRRALRILCVANSANLPTLQLAFTQPLKHLRNEGQLELQVLTEPMIGEHSRIRLMRDLSWRTYIDRELKQFQPDVVIFCRYTGIKADYIFQRSKQLGAAVINCLDDDLLSVPLEIGQAKFDYYRQPERRRTLKFLLDNADLVYSSTTALTEKLRTDGLTTPVYTAEVFCPGDVIQKAEATYPWRIGYMGFGHEHDFEQALSGVVLMMAKYPQLQFELFGTIGKPTELDQFGARVKMLSPSWNYAHFLQQLAERKWSIGICPLADLSFNKFKSNTKWLEYTCVGAAVVASDHSVYRSALSDDCGVLVKDACWAKELENLLLDTHRRESMVENAQQKVRLEYNHAKHVGQFEDLLDQLGVGANVLSSPTVAA